MVCCIKLLSTTIRNRRGNSNKNKNNNNHNNNNSSKDKRPHETVVPDTEIIMCFDSNRKFINFRKLWTLKGTTRHRTSTLASVKSAIERENATDVKYFLISVGTNDIDTKEPTDIITEYTDIVDLLRRKYPGIKIIINELPPRKEKYDDKVTHMNRLLGDLCWQNDFLSLVDQSKLREDIDKTMYDDKHVHRRSFYLYAGNIKRALRKAYGRPEPLRGDTERDP